MTVQSQDNYLLDEVVEYFSRTPLAPIFSVGRVVDDNNHPLREMIEDQLYLFSEHYIETIKNNSDFLHYGMSKIDDGNNIDKEARIWVLIQQLNFAIPNRRLGILINQIGDHRPYPYDHPALRDLEVTDDFLVPMSEFESLGSALVRNGYAFTIVPPVESTNSQYWLSKTLYVKELQEFAFVRLDPFIFNEVDKFPILEYKMWWYGRPLDWSRIHSLKEEDHGRWLPGSLSSRAEFTDFVWTPRGHEVHFQCEEFPTSSDISTRGSRYFHAIYHIEKQEIIHLDGALRIFDGNSWSQRKEFHLRKSGKIGYRIKLFRIDTPVERSILSDLCSNYYVWNNDVARYFGADLPDAL